MKNIDYISESAPYRDILYSKLERMKERCNHPSCKEYKYYGAKGVKICEEWNDPKYGFLCFYTWSITHGYKEGLTIDRINVNGNYEPDNCRYISAEEQTYNRRSTVWIWKNNKPIQLLLYCRNNNIDQKEYKNLRKKITKGLLSPMTLQPYEDYRSIRRILIDNRQTLKEYCESYCYNYYIIYHIIDTIYPLAGNIKEKELALYISYFYYELPIRKKMPKEKIIKDYIQDIPIYIDNKKPLLTYCQHLRIDYRKTYEAIIKEFPYSNIIHLSSDEAKEIIINTSNM